MRWIERLQKRLGAGKERNRLMNWSYHGSLHQLMEKKFIVLRILLHDRPFKPADGNVVDTPKVSFTKTQLSFSTQKQLSARRDELSTECHSSHMFDKRTFTVFNLGATCHMRLACSMLFCHI